MPEADAPYSNGAVLCSRLFLIYKGLEGFRKEKNKRPHFDI